MILAGSALVFVGCAQEEPLVTDRGQPIVEFQPRERVERCTGEGADRACRVVWTGDVVVAGRVAATGLTYEGDGIDDADSTVRVAWVPATRTVVPLDAGIDRQWWFVGAALLIMAGAGLEEWGRHRMRMQRRPPAPG